MQFIADVLHVDLRDTVGGSLYPVSWCPTLLLHPQSSPHSLAALIVHRILRQKGCFPGLFPCHACMRHMQNPVVVVSRGAPDMTKTAPVPSIWTYRPAPSASHDLAGVS